MKNPAQGGVLICKHLHYLTNVTLTPVSREPSVF